MLRPEPLDFDTSIRAENIKKCKSIIGWASNGFPADAREQYLKSFLHITWACQDCLNKPLNHASSRREVNAVLDPETLRVMYRAIIVIPFVHLHDTQTNNFGHCLQIIDRFLVVAEGKRNVP